MEKTGYYAVISAKVRYDQRLCPNAKLLYGEIAARCQKEGYCWATNNYFISLFARKNRPDVAVETISRWISDLEKKGHITVNIDKSKGNKRTIVLTVALLMEKSIPIDEKINTLLTEKSIPIDENVKSLKEKITDKPTVKNTDKFIFSDSSILSLKTKQQQKGYDLLVKWGVHEKVADSLVYGQNTPLESIQRTIKNGQAKAAASNGLWRLCPGYIVKTLNLSRAEGKMVAPTNTWRKLVTKVENWRGRKQPLVPVNIEAAKKELETIRLKMEGDV